MTANTPVDRVSEFLIAAGYQRIPTPLEISGLKFEFAFAFIGSAPSPDLILVADTVLDDQQRILKRIEGVARALDVSQSKRPLTLVVVGPRPTATTEAMSKVCRVLPLGVVKGEDSDANLRNWLAVLTPLEIPNTSSKIANPLGEISHHLENLDTDVASLLDLAPLGAAVVQRRLHEIIAQSLDEKDVDGLL